MLKLVVADSSPLVALANIEHVDLLLQLFGRIVAPPEVFAELITPKRPESVRRYFRAHPPWIVEQAPLVRGPIAHLHAAETAVINLAGEISADLLLIDEAAGRRAAIERSLRIAGTVGVLEMAADRGLVDLAQAFERLKQTDFWISPRLLDTRLKLRSAKESS